MIDPAMYLPIFEGLLKVCYTLVVLCISAIVAYFVIDGWRNR